MNEQATLFSDKQTHLELLTKKVNAHINFRDALDNMRHKQLFTNLTINCGEQQFQVHKVVLCASCYYFSNLFGEQETSSDNEDATKTDTVTLQGVNENVLQVLIDFMYTGRFLLVNFDMEHITELASACRKLGVFDALLQLEDTCVGLIDDDNFHLMLNMANTLDSKHLVKGVYNYIITNMKRLSKSNNLHLLSVEHFHTVMVSASGESQCPVDSILGAALTWVHQHPDQVVPFDNAISSLQFDMLSSSYVRFLLEEEPMAKSHSFLRKKLVYIIKDRPKTPKPHSRGDDGDIRDALRFKLKLGISGDNDIRNHDKKVHSQIGRGSTKGNKRQLVTAPHTTPTLDWVNNKCPPSLLIMGRDEANRASILYYGIQMDKWSEMEDLGLSLDHFPGVAYHDQRIYFVGGESTLRKEKMSTAYARDLANDLTIHLPELRIPRSEPLVICSKRGTVLAAGGVGRYGQALSHVEGLNAIGCNSWKNMHALHDKRDSTAAACILHDRMYVLGGGSKRCEYYNEENRSWHELPPIPVDGDQASVLVAGAANHVYTFDCYRPLKMFKLVWWNDSSRRLQNTPTMGMDHGNNKKQTRVAERTKYLDGKLCQWETISTKGQIPDCLTHATGYKDVIYAVDKSNKIYMYSTVGNTWLCSTRIPKTLPHPALLVALP